MSRLDTLFDFIIGHRKFVVALTLLACLSALIPIAVIGVRAEFSPQALFTTFEDQQAIDNAFQERFGNTENVVFVMIQNEDVLSIPMLNYIHDLSGDVATLEFADRMASITDTPIPRSNSPGELLVDNPIRGDSVEADEAEELIAAAMASPTVVGSLVSESRRLAAIGIFLNRDTRDIDAVQPAIDQIESIVAARAYPAGTELTLSGVPVIRNRVVNLLLHDQKVLIPIAILISIIMLFLSFRWWPGVLLPQVSVVGTSMLLVAGMAAADHPFNIINQILPTLLIVIGMSDSVHMVSRYQEEYKRTQDQKLAGRRTLRTMAAACFLTSATTAVGFASLVVSRTEILRNFGIVAAIAILLAYVVSLLLLPTAMSLAPQPKLVDDKKKGEWIEEACIKLVEMSTARPWTTLIISVFCAVGIGYSALQVNIDTKLLETFPEGSETAQDVGLMERELEGILPMEISLESQTEGRFDDPELLNAISVLEARIREEEMILEVTSYPDLLKEAWVAYSGDSSKWDSEFRSLPQVAQLASLIDTGEDAHIYNYVTPDRRYLRINLACIDAGSRRAMFYIEDLRADIDELLGDFEDVEYNLTGDVYSGSIGLSSLINDMLGSLGLAFVIIFGIMALLFRSVRMGLISMPPNIIPVALTMAYMAWSGILLNTSTVIIFSISIGLAVDDTIHLLARFREEYAEVKDLDVALRRAAAGAGRAIVVTSVMLLGGLSVMLISSFNPIRLFGELLIVTIAGCIFGDLLVLPALLKLFWKEKPA